MYIKILDDNTFVYPYYLSRLAQEHPNTSFPRNPTPEFLALYEIYPVSPIPKPASGPREKVVEGSPTLGASGWEQTWNVVPLSREELSYQESERVMRIREKRDQLLRESDWTQLTDAKVDSISWATYRQALRDIPKQAGFPLNVVWPQPPA